MNIAIDVSPLSTGHSGRGVGVYTKLLLEALQRYESAHKYFFVTNQQTFPKEVDIVHYPFFDPFAFTLPLYKPKPTIVTVHDIIPILFQDKFPRGMRGELKWQVQKKSLFGAKRIITDSITSKKDISKILRYPEDRIDTVYLASTLYDIKPSTESEYSSFKKETNIPNRFILYVGDVNWNKNIEGLIHAFHKLKDEHPDISLVMVGRAFMDTSLVETLKINTLVKSLGLERSVHITGFISESLLIGLYKQAICLVSPSFYEGFGFPVVDAMTLGCPAVASDVSSLPEIAGPSIRINPYNIESIKTGINIVIHMTVQQRKKHIKSGFTWVTNFSWKKTAHETVCSYEKIMP